MKEIAAAQQAKAWATVPGIIAQGEKQVKPATRNPDGTWTHYVTMGYASGVVDVMRFFPSRLNVNEGDTVVWESSTTADAPHTITFLGGCPDPEMVAPTPQPSGLPLILVNPAVLFPSQTVTQHSDLNASGYFNSGILFPDPTKPVSFSLKIGDAKGTVPYYCVLHDTSGMTGTLIVHEGDHDQD